MSSTCLSSSTDKQTLRDCSVTQLCGRLTQPSACWETDGKVKEKDKTSRNRWCKRDHDGMEFMRNKSKQKMSEAQSKCWGILERLRKKLPRCQLVAGGLFPKEYRRWAWDKGLVCAPATSRGQHQWCSGGERRSGQDLHQMMLQTQPEKHISQNDTLKRSDTWKHQEILRKEKIYAWDSTDSSATKLTLTSMMT